MAQKFLTDIEVTQGLVDSSGDLGVAGQVLSSTGTGTNWITNEANSTVVYLDEFTGDNSTVDFTLSVSVTDENITQVYLDGVYQHKDTYSISNTTLTFSTAPPLNADIEVITFSTATTSDDLQAGVVIIPVKNTHTASIAKGEPVYITGNVGSSARLQIAPADASNSAKMPAAGLLLQTLAVNAEGYVVTGGYLRNITTDTIDGTSTTSNDTVYVKSGGGLTMTKPTGSNLIQNIAKVARSSGGNSGSLLVSSILRTNDVPNLTTGKIWVGSANNTIESGTLHLDESNNRLGIGITSPAATLDVNGNVYIRQTGALYVNTLAGYTSGVITLNSSTNFIVPSGSVGIGTSSPSYPLEVQSGGVGTVLRAGTSFISIDPTGSAAAPSLIFNGDSNTGIYRPAADTLGFSTAGSERMRIESSGKIDISGYGTEGAYLSSKGSFRIDIDNDNDHTDRSFIISSNNAASDLVTVKENGNVGIGTTLPGAKLEIEDSGADLLDLTRTSIGTYRLAISTGDNFSIYDVGAASDRLVINSSGNIGIGTTSPNDALEVAGNNSTQHRIRVNNAGTGTATLAFMQGTTFKSWVEHNNATGNFDVWNYTNNALRFGTNNIERMRIDNSGNLLLKGGYISLNTNDDSRISGDGDSIDFILWDNSSAYQTRMTILDTGNVGIGTTSPDHTLRVNGDARLGNLHIKTSDFGAGGTGKTIYADGAGSGVLGFISTTAFDFSNGSTSRVRIDSSGNVGIGTTSPNGNLQFSNAAETRKIVLYEGANNDYEFYGFGVESQTLVYSTYTTDDDHVFFAGTSSTTRNELMRIGGDGKVGIGTTGNHFGEKLRVQGWITSGSNSIVALMGENGTGAVMGAYSNHPLILRTNNTERMRITSDGSVGIGTDSPQGKLEINLSGATNQLLLTQSTTDHMALICGTAGAGIVVEDDNYFAIWHQDYTNRAGQTGLTERLRINSAGDIYNYKSETIASTYYGYNAGNYSATGASNNAFGYDALGNVTTGNENVAMGRNALGSLTTGVHNVAVGYASGRLITTANNNTLVGFNAGTDITTGSGNMCIGYAAGENITTSNDIIAIGYAALGSTTTSIQNTAVGHLALYANTSGNYNSGIGYLALRFNTTGSENHATGRLSLYANSTGSYNVGVGGSALESNTTGSYNTAVGSGSIYSKTTGDANTAVGYRTLYLLGAGGTGNTAMGQQALQNTTSDHNVAIGRHALIANTSGNANVAIGAFAGDSNTTGVYNTYIGYDAGQAANNNENVHVGFYAGRLSTGGENTIIGSQAVRLNNSSATNTVAIGRAAMYKLSSGNDNTAIGHQAGFELTTGYSNTLVGKGSGDALTTGQSNTAIGQLSLSSATTAVGNTALGRAAMQLGTGSFNTAVGNDALENCSGSRNTAVGYASGNQVTTGEDNVLIGENVANSLTTGSYNVVIGRFAGEAATSMSYATIIGRTAGRFHTSGAEPCYIGYDAGQQVTSGNANTAIGTSAMTYGNGNYNTFVGYQSGFGQNGQSSSDNTALGYFSLRIVSTGSYNTSIGKESLRNLTTATSNTAVGRSSLYTNTTGSNNVAIGMDALFYNTTAGQNVAIGNSALQSNVTGTNSVAVGYQAGLYSTVGDNVYVGYGAGRGTVGDTGSANTFLGYGSGYNIDGGTNNVAVGTLALYDLSSGDYNNGVGRDAGQNITTGNYNNLLGYNAGGSLTTAQYNTCMGHQAGQSTTTGLYNTMIGGLAGRDNTGQNNTYIGAIAGRFGTSGSMNTVVGSQAMDNQTFTGSSNTVMGFAAGQNITTGYDNIFLGKQAGLNSNTGAGNIGIGILSLRYAQTSGNIAIGYSAAGGGTMSGGSGKNIAIGDAAMYNVTSGQNNIAIGWNAGRTGSQSPGSLGAITTNSNEIQMGNTSHTGAYIQIGWTTVSDARDKGQVKDVPHGLDFVNQLQPKSFEFKPNRNTEETDGIERYGFLAQDVLQLEGENPVIVNNNDEDKLKMTNDYLVPVLVNAIKELKQEIENLKLQINN